MDAQSSSVQSMLLPGDEIVIDIPGHEVRRAGRRISVTHLEFQLLRTLAAAHGRVLTRDELLALWGERRPSSRRSVDIHIARLRRKLGAPFDGIIETVRQVGYRCPIARASAEIAADPQLQPRFVTLKPAALAASA